MEKNTLKSLFLLMVITGSIFTFTACTPDEIALYEQKMKEQGVQVDNEKLVQRNVKVDVEQKEDKKNEDKKIVKKIEDASERDFENDDRESEDAEDDKGENYSNPAPVVTPVVPVPTSTTTSTPTVTVTTKYKDGTYTKVGSYQSPGGTDSITVTVTVKNDVVESVSLVNGAVSGTSQYYENLFIDGVSAQVVGKKLDSVSVGKVNGASLTGNGFNQAIAQIRTVAQK